MFIDQPLFNGLTNIFLRGVVAEFAVYIITDFSIWNYYKFGLIRHSKPLFPTPNKFRQRLKYTCIVYHFVA